jgi:multidrug efflux pump subunit AcrA (membrane-fusion protein)
MVHRMWIIILTGALLAGCERAAAKRAPKAEAVSVSVAMSTVGPVQREVEIVGTLYGDEEATVSAKVPGRIVQIARDVGDRAAPGEPLAQIDKTDYELAVAQKEMAVAAALAKLGLSTLPQANFDPTTVPTVERSRLESENAKAKLNRAQQLFDQKPPLISEQDYADIKTAYEGAKSNYDVELLTARAQVAEARARQSELDAELQRLRDATVRAPDGGNGVDRASLMIDRERPSTAPPTIHNPPSTSFSSKRYAIAARLISVGEYVREGTALFRLVADDPIKFRSQVPERFLSEVKVGQKVRVNVEAYDEPFAGVVSRITPQVDVNTRTFGVEILVPNAQGKLQSGAFARGMVLTRVQENVTFVPLDALVTFAGVTKVFTVENGKAVEKKVETGQRVGERIEIVAGLSGAATVVTEGASKLAGGTPVKPANVQSATQQ